MTQSAALIKTAQEREAKAVVLELQQILVTFLAPTATSAAFKRSLE